MQQKKADSTLRSSRAVPHPSTNRALRRLTPEVRRDPVHSTRYGRQKTTLELRSSPPDFPGEQIHKNSFDQHSLPTPFKLNRCANRCESARIGHTDPPGSEWICANPRSSASQIRRADPRGPARIRAHLLPLHPDRPLQIQPLETFPHNGLTEAEAHWATKRRHDRQ